MISLILIIAEPSKEASISLLKAFRTIRKYQTGVKAIFVSYLSDPFKKDVDPAMPNHPIKEKEEALSRINDYFTRMEIPYDSKAITVPPWEMVFREITDGVYDLIILQSKILKNWRKEEANCALCSDAISKTNCPILVIYSHKDNQNP